MSKYFPEDPALCAQRRNDPDWQREQLEKNAAASEAFAARRVDAGMPLIVKKRY